MAYTPKFYGKAVNNKFVFDKRSDFDFYMEKFKDNTPLEMTVKRKYKQRTSGKYDEETSTVAVLSPLVNTKILVLALTALTVVQPALGYSD